MIARSIKKDIIDKWSHGFADLSVYARNKLYKTCGIFLMGIEIWNVPRREDYRPIFVCYPLWRADVKQCLDEPIFMQEIYNRKGLQFNIPYTKHDNFFQEAAECTRKQVSILGHRHISIEQLFDLFDKQFSQTLIKSSPVGQAALFEAKLLGALYVNDAAAIKNVLAETYQISRTWPPDLFEWKYGKLNVWLQNLETVISNRDEFLKKIELNKRDKKIAALERSELIA